MNNTNLPTFALLYNVSMKHGFEINESDLKYIMQRLLSVALYTASETEEQRIRNPDFAIETIKKVVNARSRRLTKYELQNHIDRGSFLIVRNVFN